jgi:methylase of polypeptide subunit release factors
MTNKSSRQHEVAFCAEVSKFSDKIFDASKNLPFGYSKIETFGTGSNKRHDLQFFNREDKLILTGEVKLPGTIQGQSAFNQILMKDAFDKATMENCRYFFTWNVNEFALFDRSKWDAPTMYDRCVGQWSLGLNLNKPTDVTSPRVIRTLQEEFLPKFFHDFAEILEGKKETRKLPPADFYLNALLGFINVPVHNLQNYLEEQSLKDSKFNERLGTWMTKEQEWNFNPDDFNSWREILQRASESMCYVLHNRILFYNAVKTRNKLPDLDFSGQALKNPQAALEHLQECFREAVNKTGDYESIFFPEKTRDEWTTLVALSSENALEAWNNIIKSVERFNFKEIPSDILGKTFQKLISPEERHRFGQHYTEETIVDLMNAFCIRKGDAKVFDPSCGSGSFLVRAYYRKHQLDKSLSHQELLASIYGCDINPYPAHLATLNLAARQLANEENYPRIAHTNFFKVEPNKTFCELPRMEIAHDGRKEREEIKLPELDAIIGNPPYVEQTKISKRSDNNSRKKDSRIPDDQTKEYITKVADSAYPNSNLSKQSDLHVYFWLASARFLSRNGWFGFLTSSSWLDAKYGFALQRWILSHFKLVAIIESLDEPWFSDARVKTCATIMQLCNDSKERDENQVKFVRLKRPLIEILKKADWEHIEEHDGQEHLRQHAAEDLRDLILKTKTDKSSDELRIVVKRQGDLWSEGLSVAEMFAHQKELSKQSLEDEEDEAAEVHTSTISQNNDLLDYGGGKWGRYIRAPKFYFEIIKEFGAKFIPLGNVALIKRGITSGCDDFFMPRDVSAKLLEKHETESEWRILPLMRRCKRAEVESGKVKIIEAGDKTLHPIESKFVRPEIHSPMQLDKPIVTANQTDRVVLWTNKPLIGMKGTYAHDYISWGSRQTFESKKSKPVPVPLRSTCLSRELWYDVTGLTPGIGFLTKAQKYRHIVPYNPEKLTCNCNLYDIHSVNLSEIEEKTMMAILNSTIVGFFKHFYGRYAGSEGTLKLEVVDALMMEIPSPIGVSAELSAKLEKTLQKISQRDVTHLLEEEFRLCTRVEEMRVLENKPIGLPLELQREDRRELDLLVFELLGVKSTKRREELVDRLYYETTKYYRAQRIQDIQSSANRTQSGGKNKVSPNSLAMGAWEEIEPHLKTPLREWLEKEVTDGKTIEIPEGVVRLPEVFNMFEATTLYFGDKKQIDLILDNRAEAELLEKVASVGLRGKITIPKTEKETQNLLSKLENYLSEAEDVFTDSAQQYASDEKLQGQIKNIMFNWFVHGK